MGWRVFRERGNVAKDRIPVAYDEIVTLGRVQLIPRLLSY